MCIPDEKGLVNHLTKYTFEERVIFCKSNRINMNPYFKEHTMGLLQNDY